MKRWKVGMAAVLSVLLLGLPGESAAQEFETGALSLKFNGRIQIQAGTSSCDEFPVAADSKCGEQVPSTDLFLRRVRLTVTGKIGENIDFRIQPDYNKVTQVVGSNVSCVFVSPRHAVMNRPFLQQRQ